MILKAITDPDPVFDQSLLVLKFAFVLYLLHCVPDPKNETLLINLTS